MRAAVRDFLLALVPLAAILLIGGVAGEVYLRLQHADVRESLDARTKGKERCTRASADRRRIYEGIPDRCDQNALGFRDVAHAFAKPAGVFRIAIIGDSVAMGQGVRPDEAFGRVLENRLKAAGANVEVILLAVTGYSTSQQMPLLELAFQFHPDLIVWTYVLNDPADPIVDNANGELGAYFHAPASYVLDYLGTLWSRAADNFRARDCPSEWHLRLHCVHRAEIAQQFGAIARVAKEHRTPIVVALLPLLPQGAFQTYEYLPIHQDLRAMAQERGLPVIDTLDAFAGADVESLRLPSAGSWLDPWHPNARGHDLIGRYLAQHLDIAGRRKGP